MGMLAVFCIVGGAATMLSCKGFLDALSESPPLPPPSDPPLPPVAIRVEEPTAAPYRFCLHPDSLSTSITEGAVDYFVSQSRHERVNYSSVLGCDFVIRFSKAERARGCVCTWGNRVMQCSSEEGEWKGPSENDMGLPHRSPYDSYKFSTQDFYVQIAHRKTGQAFDFNMCSIEKVSLVPYAQKSGFVIAFRDEEMQSKGVGNALQGVFQVNVAVRAMPRSSASNAVSAVVGVDAVIPQGVERRPYAIAALIGNQRYRDDSVPPAQFALRDVETMGAYFQRAFGLKPENIHTWADASFGELGRIFGTDRGQLHKLVQASQSRCESEHPGGKSEDCRPDVFVYYSGHGAPSVEKGETYLVPSDGHPDYVDSAGGGLALSLLENNLAMLPAKSVTLILESCFSGSYHSGPLVKNASPIVKTRQGHIENPPSQVVLMAASQGDQIAHWYPQMQHGLFTYFFLKGLQGNADFNLDGAITVREMNDYLAFELPRFSWRAYARDQRPDIRGAMERVLIRLAQRQ